MLGVFETVIDSCVSAPGLTEAMQPLQAILQFAVKAAHSLADPARSAAW